MNNGATSDTEFSPLMCCRLYVFLEQEAADLDVWADLFHRGPTFEGETGFSRRGRPTVRVIAELQEPHRENQLRTTLTHELRHVKLHNYLCGLYAGISSPWWRVTVVQSGFRAVTRQPNEPIVRTELNHAKLR